MELVEKLRIGQQAIIDQMALTDRLCDRSTPPDQAKLAEARWALVRLLMEHVAFEERAIFGPLDEHPDPAARALASNLRASQLAFNNRLIAHAEKWTAQAVEQDWPGFRAAVKAIYHAILERAKWAERELFPLDAILCDNDRYVTKHNWVRAVWSVKDALVGR